MRYLKHVALVAVAFVLVSVALESAVDAQAGRTFTNGDLWAAHRLATNDVQFGNDNASYFSRIHSVACNAHPSWAAAGQAWTEGSKVLQYRVQGTSAWTTFVPNCRMENAVVRAGVWGVTFPYTVGTTQVVELRASDTCWYRSGNSLLRESTWRGRDSACYGIAHGRNQRVSQYWYRNAVAPSVPTVAGSPGTTSITISWGADANASGWHVEQSSDAGATWTRVAVIDASANRTYTLENLTPATRYSVAVRALGIQNGLFTAAPSASPGNRGTLTFTTRSSTAPTGPGSGGGTTTDTTNYRTLPPSIGAIQERESPAPDHIELLVQWSTSELPSEFQLRHYTDQEVVSLTRSNLGALPLTDPVLALYYGGLYGWSAQGWRTTALGTGPSPADAERSRIPLQDGSNPLLVLIQYTPQANQIQMIITGQHKTTLEAEAAPLIEWDRTGTIGTASARTVSLLDPLDAALISEIAIPSGAFNPDSETMATELTWDSLALDAAGFTAGTSHTIRVRRARTYTTANAETTLTVPAPSSHSFRVRSKFTDPDFTSGFSAAVEHVVSAPARRSTIPGLGDSPEVGDFGITHLLGVLAPGDGRIGADRYRWAIMFAMIGGLAVFPYMRVRESNHASALFVLVFTILASWLMLAPTIGGVSIQSTIAPMLVIIGLGIVMVMRKLTVSPPRQAFIYIALLHILLWAGTNVALDFNDNVSSAGDVLVVPVLQDFEDAVFEPTSDGGTRFRFISLNPLDWFGSIYDVILAFANFFSFGSYFELFPGNWQVVLWFIRAIAAFTVFMIFLPMITTILAQAVRVLGNLNPLGRRQ